MVSKTQPSGSLCLWQCLFTHFCKFFKDPIRRYSILIIKQKQHFCNLPKSGLDLSRSDIRKAEPMPIARITIAITRSRNWIKTSIYKVLFVFLILTQNCVHYWYDLMELLSLSSPKSREWLGYPNAEFRTLSPVAHIPKYCQKTVYMQVSRNCGPGIRHGRKWKQREV